MALNVARNAVPPAPAGEGAAADAAARLNMAAAVAERAEEHDSTDPLGRGRIDTRLLTLVSSVHPHGLGAADEPLVGLACQAGVIGWRVPQTPGRIPAPIHLLLLLTCRPKETAVPH